MPSQSCNAASIRSPVQAVRLRMCRYTIRRSTASFYICVAHRVVGHAAAARKPIMHAGAIFENAGLSCVMTGPACQGRGLGLRTVLAAPRCMERGNLDIGIFTCDPHAVHFCA